MRRFAKAPAARANYLVSRQIGHNVRREGVKSGYALPHRNQLQGANEVRNISLTLPHVCKHIQLAGAQQKHVCACWHRACRVSKGEKVNRWIKMG